MFDFPQHPRGGSQLPVIPVQGILLCLLTSVGTAHRWYTDIHATRTLIHIKLKILKNILEFTNVRLLHPSFLISFFLPLFQPLSQIISLCCLGWLHTWVPLVSLSKTLSYRPVLTCPAVKGSTSKHHR